MDVKIQQVQTGDVIRDGGKQITVRAVDRFPDHCAKHVHINGALCWDWDSVVSVTRHED